MKNKRTKITSLLTVLLAVLGVCLLLVGGIGGARAALTTKTDDFTAEMTTPTIKVELYENDSEEPVCDSTDPETVGTLLEDLEIIPVGEPYPEELTVKNTGSADAFVRVTIYKYWTASVEEEEAAFTKKSSSDEEMEKRVDLDPSYISLVFGDGWAEDKTASTKERTVLYYTKALAPNEESSPAVTKVMASSKLSELVEQTVTPIDDTHTKITSTYQYDGLTLNLEASVDAIQTSNAQTAIKAAWGVTHITADEAAGKLTVPQN